MAKEQAQNGKRMRDEPRRRVKVETNVGPFLAGNGCGWAKITVRDAARAKSFSKNKKGKCCLSRSARLTHQRDASDVLRTITQRRARPQR